MAKIPRKGPGRPPEFKPEYCEQLIEHMAEGFSFEAFAGAIRPRRCVQTIYNWADKFPEFLEAKNIGSAACRYFWERKGIVGLDSYKDGPTLNTGVWAFNMKNRFNWSDKRDITQTIDAKVEDKSKEQQQMVDELKDLLKTKLSERYKAKST